MFWSNLLFTYKPAKKEKPCANCKAGNAFFQHLEIVCSTFSGDRNKLLMKWCVSSEREIEEREKAASEIRLFATSVHLRTLHLFFAILFSLLGSSFLAGKVELPVERGPEKRLTRQDVLLRAGVTH